jgi:hypothetical protein
MMAMGSELLSGISVFKATRHPSRRANRQMTCGCAASEATGTSLLERHMVAGEANLTAHRTARAIDGTVLPSGAMTCGIVSGGAWNQRTDTTVRARGPCYTQALPSYGMAGTVHGTDEAG